MPNYLEIPSQNEPEEETSYSSSSFSNWEMEIKRTASRKRHLGRVKIGAMPQRMTEKNTSESTEISLPMPQR